MRLPGQDPLLLFDGAVEVLAVNEAGDGLEEYPAGSNEPAIVLFGAVVPTACEHTHVEALVQAPQPWN